VNFMARIQLEKHYPSAASAIFRPRNGQGHMIASMSGKRATRHDVSTCNGMISKVVKLRSVLFKHTAGQGKPREYEAQVLGYIAQRDVFDVVFFDKYTSQQLAAFIANYKGRAKRADSVAVYTYTATDFWKAFLGEAGRPGYSMRSHTPAAWMASASCAAPALVVADEGACAGSMLPHTACSPMSDAHGSAAGPMLSPDAHSLAASMPSHTAYGPRAASPMHSHATSTDTHRSPFSFPLPKTAAQARPRRQPRTVSLYVAGPAPSPSAAHQAAREVANMKSSSQGKQKLQRVHSKFDAL